MTDAFFIQLSDSKFAPTDHTRGPWTPEAQHAGPPAALIGRCIEQPGDRDDMQIVRISYEILKPVPVEELTVKTDVVRAGKKVELIEARLSASDEEIIRARAWRIRIADLDLGISPSPKASPPGPSHGHTVPAFTDTGYLAAMETIFVAGSFLEAGPATAWFRMRYPLIDGEETSPLSRVLIAADSGNGISASLDWSKWLFINTDLTVSLHRLPRGEWVCLDAETFLEASGIGLAASVISDQEGHIGRGMQSLFVGPR